mmetsp:Transcript_95992/g.291589  ORF Transcript_95992/g.291589 Transcript_95992/m.291589 type:complete len:500 (+) Transcript_95992:88-1587(+)
MDEEAARVPNEAVADLHKALAREAPRGEPGYGPGYGSLSRSMSEGDVVARGDEAARLKTPGGFRRHYLNERAEAAGVPLEERPGTWQRSLMESVRSASVSHRESLLGIRLHPVTGAEVTPERGQATEAQTVLTILKSFVGSGITFMPGAFAKGGWLFSVALLLAIALVNGLCIRLLVDCRTRTGCSSFGEIAQLAGGWGGKLLVQISLVVSQFGFCTVYFIFISELAASMGVSSTKAAVLLQLVPVAPLCLIRDVEHLAYPNLVADVLIMFGLGVVLVTSAVLICSSAPAFEPTVPFKSDTCGIFIGTAIFTFEGLPMMLPIQSSMREPERFLPLFKWLFPCIALLFVVFGLLGYLAYGGGAETVVLLNLPQPSALTCVVKVGYMLALVLSQPLMFLPAARITELWAFGVVKPAEYTWRKNFLRMAEVLLFAFVALKGSAFFDKFLSFTGAFCCAPIAFIYPTVFHLRLCACSLGEQLLDGLLLVLGLAAVGVALYSCF